MPQAAIRISHETQIKACRDVPKLARVLGHWEVQHSTICDGWVNCWMVCEDGETEKPQTFATRDAAAKELREHLADCMLAYQMGDLETPYTADEFQIVFVEG